LQAFRQVARFVSGQDRDWGRMSLATWELVGFGLGKAFPNAAYLADSGPPLTQLPPDFIQKLTEADTDEKLKALSPEVELLIERFGPLLFKWLLKQLGL
jgi:hypothetical protein